MSDERPRIGHGIVGVIEGVKDAITKRTGLDAYMEPTPQRASKTSVLVMPKTIDFRSEGEARDLKHVTYTVMLGVDLVLNGEGSGTEFLAEALEGSFKMGRFLESPVSIEYGTNMYATLSAEKSSSGRFFESEEEGSMFYVYEEQWSGTVYFPVFYDKDADPLRANHDPIRTINMS